jgi:hypothetical protein
MFYVVVCYIRDFLTTEGNVQLKQLLTGNAALTTKVTTLFQGACHASLTEMQASLRTIGLT